MFPAELKAAAVDSDTEAAAAFSATVLSEDFFFQGQLLRSIGEILKVKHRKQM